VIKGTSLLAASLTFFCVLPAVSLGGEKDKKETKKEQTKWEGKLMTGVVAIGGETTGVVLKGKTGTVELDLGTNKDLLARAEKLNGKDVIVTGKLEIRKGVEIAERRIVTVTDLKPAPEAKKDIKDAAPPAPKNSSSLPGRVTPAPVPAPPARQSILLPGKCT
jgi:hypothetical protein